MAFFRVCPAHPPINRGPPIFPPVLNPTLEKQIAAASRGVEEARRIAHRDPARLADLVEQIHSLAELRQQEGDFRKAESLYREALFRVQDARTPDPNLTVGIYSLMAYLYDRWGKPKEAVEFYQKALTLGQERGVRDPNKVATMKNNLAMLYKNMREYDKAQACYEDALAGFRAAHGPDSPMIASVYNNLGVLLYQNLEVERALDMHLQALRIREATPPSELDAGELSQTYVNLGAVYKALGDFQKAHEYMEKARNLTVARPGEDLPRPSSSAPPAAD
jgi:tetratricopeptide (TPR) repeat protein